MPRMEVILSILEVNVSASLWQKFINFPLHGKKYRYKCTWRKDNTDYFELWEKKKKSPKFFVSGDSKCFESTYIESYPLYPKKKWSTCPD